MTLEQRNDDRERAARILARAGALTLLVGPRARPAARVIGELARRLGAAVLTTPDAKSIFDESDPHAGGVFSFGATALARAIVEGADAVLALGTNLGEFASQGGAAFERAAVVQIVGEAAETSIGIHAAVTIVGDVVAEVQALVDRFDAAKARPRWFDGLGRPDDRRAVPHAPTHPPSRQGGIDPFHAMRAIGEALPERSRLACDVTSAGLHVLHDLTLGPDRRLWMQIERSACMGTALSAGLGVRLASDLATLVVIGDWGMMMGHSELHTVASLGVDRFAIVVWSNAGGALIRAGVRAQGIEVPAQMHSWTAPRFELVARGYGLRAWTVRSARALRRSVAAAMRARTPVLIDAIIEPNAEIPGARDRYVHLDASPRAS